MTTLDTPFDDLVFVEGSTIPGDHIVFAETEHGTITVLNRMTGFGRRDIETGYRAPNGDFWLASGLRDVRKSGAVTLGEAIEWIKAHHTPFWPAKDEK